MKSRLVQYGLPGITMIVIGGLVVWAGWGALPKVELASAELESKPATDNGQSPLRVPGLEEFASVWDKQLYTPRVESPPPIEEVAAESQSIAVEPAMPPPEPPVVLVQVLFSEQARLAVFELKGTGKKIRLVEDQSYDGLLIKKIMPEQVTIQFEGHVIDVSLNSTAKEDGGTQCP